jgi:uncharacterized Zn ribbon protein
MTAKQCKHCQEPFIPREDKQRFCCRQCSIEWWQDERRQALEFYRQHREEERPA